MTVIPGRTTFIPGFCAFSLHRNGSGGAWTVDRASYSKSSHRYSERLSESARSSQISGRIPRKARHSSVRARLPHVPDQRSNAVTCVVHASLVYSEARDLAIQTSYGHHKRMIHRYRRHEANEAGRRQQGTRPCRRCQGRVAVAERRSATPGPGSRRSRGRRSCRQRRGWCRPSGHVRLAVPPRLLLDHRQRLAHPAGGSPTHISGVGQLPLGQVQLRLEFSGVVRVACAPAVDHRRGGHACRDCRSHLPQPEAGRPKSFVRFLQLVPRRVRWLRHGAASRQAER